MSEFEEQPEIARMLDERAAEQAARFAARTAQAQPLCQRGKQLGRLQLTIDFGGQGNEAGRIVKPFRLSEAIAPGPGVGAPRRLAQFDGQWPIGRD